MKDLAQPFTHKKSPHGTESWIVHNGDGRNIAVTMDKHAAQTICEALNFMFAEAKKPRRCPYCNKAKQTPHLVMDGNKICSDCLSMIAG
jgi:Zn finger protein HypA/HybF involved in hydrogenase expression